MADFTVSILARPDGQQNLSLTSMAGWMGDRWIDLRFVASPTPYSGGMAIVDKIAVLWSGDWRNKEEVYRRHKIPVETPEASAIAMLWPKIGYEVLQCIRGVSAGVIWDRCTSELQVFRDKVGLIPFFYAKRADEGWEISTDVDLLIERAGLAYKPNLHRVHAFLRGANSQDDDDFITGVVRIKPGDRLLFRTSSPDPDIRRYWEPDTSYFPASDALPGKFREILQEAMAGIQLETTAVEMSGGLDSPSLAYLLGVNYEQPGERKRVQTVSLVAPGMPQTDESEAINLLEGALALNAYRFPLNEHWPLKDPGLFRAYRGTGPHAHPEEHYIAQFHQWARDVVGVNHLVSGVGADQVLSCSKSILLRYLAKEPDILGLCSELTQRRLSEIVSEIGVLVNRALPPRMQQSRIKAIVKRQLLTNSQRALDKPWRAGGWIRSPHDTGSPAEPIFLRTLGEMKLGSLRSWHWEQACRTGYREARRMGIVRHYPYLNDLLWEFTLRVPPSHLRRGKRTKLLLFEAMVNRLPWQVLYAKKRGIFDPIVEKGLANREVAFVASLFRDSWLDACGLIDRTHFLDDYKKYVFAHSEARPYLGSFPIWRTVAAELWGRTL